MALKPARLQWSEDGTLLSPDYGDIYFQPQQGPAESHYVFLEKNDLRARFSAPPQGRFRIAELGFGCGLNFLLTSKLWRETAPQGTRLVYAAIEKHPVTKEDLRRIHAAWPELRALSGELIGQYPPLIEGLHHLRFLDGRIHLMLLFGDVADTLPELRGTFDAWYLDGFSPAKNPAMWQENIFSLIAARTEAGGTLSTFSSASAVRRGLQAAGFDVKKTAGHGRKHEMTVAKMPGAPAQAAGKKTAIVLGAGVAGSSAAFALAQKGFDVAVLERRSKMAGVPLNPFGVLYPRMTVDPSASGRFHQHGFCFTRNLATALKIKSWHPCGVRHLNLSPEDEKRHRALAGQGWPEDYLRYEEGLLLPMAGHMSPLEFCAALLDHPNIEVRNDMTVPALEGLQADAVVVALANASKNFPATVWLPLQSLRGQISAVKANAASSRLETVTCHDGYFTPAIDGLHYAGATFQKENPVFPPEIREADHAENLAKLNAALPDLKFTHEDVVQGLAGYRAATPDRLPIAGPCPDHASFVAAHHASYGRVDARARGNNIPGLYLSTGMGSHGFSNAPVCGEIVASLLSGDPLPVPQSLLPYVLPERFILRDLKRGKI